MKDFNHRRVVRLIESCVPSGNDERDRMMSLKMMLEIIEILKDCGCSNCTQLLSGYKLAAHFVELNDIQAAAIALTQIIEKQGYLMALAHTRN